MEAVGAHRPAQPRHLSRGNRAVFDHRLSEMQSQIVQDWRPLVPSSRMKMQHILPDTYILVINDVITKDEGLTFTRWRPAIRPAPSPIRR